MSGPERRGPGDVRKPDKTPNLILRYIREYERKETRAEFAEAMMRAGERLGESVFPSERYVARLEDGDIKYPRLDYRRVLSELCQRPISDLGFTLPARGNAAVLPADVFIPPPRVSEGTQESQFRAGDAVNDGGDSVIAATSLQLYGLYQSTPATKTDQPKIYPADDGALSIELIEMMRQGERTDVGAGTLEALFVVVDSLCRDYPTVLASVLAERARQYLRFVFSLLDGRVTFPQRRELLVIAGWLAALLGCVEYDSGNRLSAETARRIAHELGTQAGHGEIVGWAWEMAAWFALMEGRLTDAVSAAQAGQQHAGNTNAGVQLPLQEARALARMGDKSAIKALRAGEEILNGLPYAQNPEHHFVFDRTKFEFYTATILTWLKSDDIAAEKIALEVARQCRRADGSLRWPTRLSTTRINLGLIAGRRGDLDEAVDYGRSALEFERRSAELLPRAEELHKNLAEEYRHEPLVAELGEVLNEERKALITNSATPGTP